MSQDAYVVPDDGRGAKLIVNFASPATFKARVGRSGVLRVILCAACGAEWVGRSGRPTRALSRGLPEEGRSVDRSDPKFASERCARRVGRSRVVYQYYRGYAHLWV